MKVTRHLFPQLDNRTEVPGSLRELVDEGKLGVKKGSGYYENAYYEKRTHWEQILKNIIEVQNH